MTDAEGRFKFGVAPERNGKLVKLVVTHVGFNSFETQVLWPSSGLRVVMEPANQTLLPALVASSSSTHSSSVAEVRKLEVSELDAVPATSRIQALRSVAGVHIVSAGQGMLRPVLRGLSGLRVATLFLNARVESQAWGEGHGIFFPEQGVARMDVIRGPMCCSSARTPTGVRLRLCPWVRFRSRED